MAHSAGPRCAMPMACSMQQIQITVSSTSARSMAAMDSSQAGTALGDKLSVRFVAEFQRLRMISFAAGDVSISQAQSRSCAMVPGEIEGPGNLASDGKERTAHRCQKQR